MARLKEAQGDAARRGRAARRGAGRVHRRLLPQRAPGPRRCGHACSPPTGTSTRPSPGRRARSLSADDDLSYLREYEHVTLARVLLARHTAAGDGDDLLAAIALLQRLLAAAEAGGRTGTVIEVLVLQALAHHADGDAPRGLAHLGVR